MAFFSKLQFSRAKFLEIRSSVPYITCMVAVAVFTEAFLYAIVDAVFPFSLTDRNHVAEDNVQEWVEYLFSAEALGVLVAAPVFGWVSDHAGNRKIPLLFGSGILLISHTTLCLANNLVALVIGRVLQGVSAAAVWGVGLALLADACPSESVGKILGYATAGYSIGGLIAPFIGGVLYKYAGYYAVFGIGFGVIAVDATLRLLLIEPKKVKVQGDDGTVSISSEILPLPITPESSLSIEKEENDLFDVSFAMEQQNNPRRSLSTSTEQTLCTDTSSTLTDAQDMPKKHRRPFVTLLKSRRMLVNFALNAVNSMIISGLNVTLALFVQDQFHWDSQGAGFIYIALTSPTLLQMIYGRCVDKFGARWPATIGMLIGVVPFACFRFVEQDSITHKVLLGALVFIIGFGVSLTLAATMTEFTSVTVEKETREPGSMGNIGALAQSYSLFNISWAIGAIAGSNFAGQIHRHAGWGMMGVSYAVLSGVMIIPAVLMCGGWIGQKKERSERVSKVHANSTEQLV